MRRRSLIVAMVLAAALGAILGGCGGSGSADEGGGKTVAPRTGGTEMLALQSGTGASMRRGAGGTYELTIDQPSARTLYFTDSPARRVMTGPARRFPEWVKDRTAKQGYPANVTLNWDQDGAPESLVAELSGISYRKHTGQLRATLDPLKVGADISSSTDTGQVHLEPFSNRSVSMVYDGSYLDRCFAAIDVPEATIWTLKGSSVEHDDWTKSPPATIGGVESTNEVLIGAESSSIWLGCEFEVTYEDDEGHSFKIWVDNPWSGSAKYSCDAAGGAKCHSESEYDEERNEASLEAEIS